MKSHGITLEQARGLALRSFTAPDAANAKEAAAQAVRRLGYVQIDTISVVERAHHHVLWSRVGDAYAPALLDGLMGSRQVLEYWSHAAAFLPMEDYRYCLPRMHHFRKRVHPWLKANKKLTAAVLERIRAEGPLRSSDFETPKGHKGGWFQRKPAKVALERLFHTGELMVARRDGFQKVYDLPERVLLTGTDTSEPTDSELGRHLVLRALDAHGFASAREIGYLRSPATRAAIKQSLTELTDAGALVPVAVQGRKDVSYAKPEDLKRIPSAQNGALHLLSPFDNVVIQRKRLQELFGFDYLIECYVPGPKRKHGYFSLPILWNGRFVGRLDPKAHREDKVLEVRSLHLEKGFKPDAAFKKDLAATLARFAAFNGCTDVRVPKSR